MRLSISFQMYYFPTICRFYHTGSISKILNVCSYLSIIEILKLRIYDCKYSMLKFTTVNCT